MIMQFKNFYETLNIVFILASGCEFFFAKCVQHLYANIYGMKLNEGHFSSGTVIIHF